MRARGKESAGTLLYRRNTSGLEVLIVQPSGPAARWGWSIPKGLPDAGEELEDAARRETEEETGCVPGALAYLGYVDYVRSRKRIHCFYGSAPEQEPRARSWEIAAARFMPLAEARRHLHPDQSVFVDWLEAKLASDPRRV